jgi:hypothetical protein
MKARSWTAVLTLTMLATAIVPSSQTRGGVPVAGADNPAAAHAAGSLEFYVGRRQLKLPVDDN